MNLVDLKGFLVTLMNTNIELEKQGKKTNAIEVVGEAGLGRH